MKKLIAAMATIAVLASVLAAGAQEADLDALRSLAFPDPEHAELQRYVGEWEVEGTVRDLEAREAGFRGRVTARMALGDLFLESEMRAEVDGGTFVGRGVLGFDGAAGEFVQVWYSELSSTLITSRGACIDERCERREMTAQVVDPVWGRTMRSREVVVWIDGDTYRSESFLAHEDGREFPQLEYTARRRSISEPPP